MTKLYVILAQTMGAYDRCMADKDKYERVTRHAERITKLVRAHMPSGGGFDSGTLLDFAESSEEKLVFHTSFHHMHESGMYDGWTEHVVTVKPSLAFGFRLSISGRDRNGIKDYIAECFNAALETEVE